MVLYWTTIRNLNFSLRRDHQKKSYERRAYESVDDKSLSQAISQKTMKPELVTERVNIVLTKFIPKMENCTSIDNISARKADSMQLYKTHNHPINRSLLSQRLTLQLSYHLLSPKYQKRYESRKLYINIYDIHHR